MEIDINLLTPGQVDYWKDPSKKRDQQRAKYARYPEKIYEFNRAWQKKNSKHYSKLCSFSQRIKKARLAGDEMAVNLLFQEKEAYKKAWRAENRPPMDEETRKFYCEERWLKKRYRSHIFYYKNKKHDLEKAAALEKQMAAELEALKSKSEKAV